MKALILPAAVKTIILCPDGDTEGARAARQAGDRFLDQGRRVKIAATARGVGPARAHQVRSLLCRGSAARCA